MKLNGLTNNLAGNDKSLSNSYLSHIVELLRNEVANLTAKENALEAITTDHIETQKEVVDTKVVNTDKINTSSINDKIILTNVIDVLTNLKVNGKDVLTEGTFQGPFVYKGITENLPVDATAGDVYISNDKVNIYNGSSWDAFVLPIGTISLAEYNADKTEILNQISNTQLDLENTKTNLEDFKTTTNNTLQTHTTDISEIKTNLVNKVDEAPVDNNSYVRKNGEWVEQTAADNTVKSIAGNSTVENTEIGVKIETPKVEITTPDFKVNGTELPEVNKFGLSKTVDAGNDYYYEMKFGRSPFDSTSSIRPMHCGYNSTFNTFMKAAPEMFTVFTKNWQYTKWNSASTGGDDQTVQITAMDKDGNINLMPNNYIDWIADSTNYLTSSCFITFNQEYVPEGYEDTVYLFCPGGCPTATINTQKPYLIEYKDGQFSRKIDIYNGAGKLKEQGYTPTQFNSGYSIHIGFVGGKGLRNKNIQRLCITCFNDGDIGAKFAIIIGGDKNSKPTDPFDPTKCIYVPFPATAYYSYDCMAATDSAWYLQESETGRMMRITPNGQVVELNLTEKVISCGFNYIEYTDKNNRPAVAYYVHNKSSGGGHYVVFLEEGDNGQVNFTERKVTSTAFTPTGDQWYSQLFKFMENSHYIFFTADCGSATSGGVNYGSASMKNMLWYWDKKTLTTHAINNFYEGLTFGTNDFIEMHKTRGNAIWFPYLIQDFAEASRTGEIHFISDIDYTKINEETGVDEGEIQVQTSTVGTTHSFFTAQNSSGSMFGLAYTHTLQSNSPRWDHARSRCQLSATNDDGILCIISGDAKSIALCYGDGNIKVYPVSSNKGIYDCDADKESYIPDKAIIDSDWGNQPALYGLTHGWVFQVFSVLSNLYPSSNNTYQTASFTYIGLKYKNGEPTILETPHLNKIIRCGSCFQPQRIKFEKYGYLQTYDDYERRKKVLGEIRSYIGYGNYQTGNDCYFKEVRKEKKKLNLTYNNQIISSVEQ